MNNTQQPTEVQYGAGHGSVTSYVTGFALSLFCTLTAYALVYLHVQAHHEEISHGFLYAAVTILALAQLIVQLVSFLHMGRASTPRWNKIVFAYAALLVAIIVGGSLWIMSHLDYNMMQMPSAQVDTYMLDQ